MIKEFWENKDKFTDIKQLKSEFIESFTDDFTNPDRFLMWKEIINDLNIVMYSNLDRLGFDLTNWIDLSYDVFCNLLIKNAIKFIDTNKSITEEDMIYINETVIRDYAMSLNIDKKQVKNNISVNDIISAIKMRAR